MSGPVRVVNRSDVVGPELGRLQKFGNDLPRKILAQ